MKKFLVMAVAVLMCTGLQAQIVQSRSVSIKTEKAPSETTWFIRGGLNMAGMAGDDLENFGRRAAYQIDLGFQKAFTNVGLYWGMDFGLGSRGFKIDEDGYEDKMIGHNFQLSPANLGWKYEIFDNFKVDLHLGAYLSCDYTGKEVTKYAGVKETLKMKDFEGYNRFDAGMNIGFGVWYGRYNLDFTFQRGFVSAIDDIDMYASNLMLRLGVAF